MKFYEITDGYYINLEDISIFHIYVMNAKDYERYNQDRNIELDRLNFIIHIVYKSGSDDGAYYPLTTHERNQFLDAIGKYVV